MTQIYLLLRYDLRYQRISFLLAVLATLIPMLIIGITLTRTLGVSQFDTYSSGRIVVYANRDVEAEYSETQIQKLLGPDFVVHTTVQGHFYQVKNNRGPMMTLTQVSADFVRPGEINLSYQVAEQATKSIGDRIEFEQRGESTLTKYRELGVPTTVSFIISGINPSEKSFVAAPSFYDPEKISPEAVDSWSPPYWIIEPISGRDPTPEEISRLSANGLIIEIDAEPNVITKLFFPPREMAALGSLFEDIGTNPYLLSDSVLTELLFTLFAISWCCSITSGARFGRPYWLLIGEKLDFERITRTENIYNLLLASVIGTASFCGGALIVFWDWKDNYPMWTPTFPLSAFAVILACLLGFTYGSTKLSQWLTSNERQKSVNGLVLLRWLANEIKK